MGGVCCQSFVEIKPSLNLKKVKATGFKNIMFKNVSENNTPSAMKIMKGHSCKIVSFVELHGSRCATCSTNEIIIWDLIQKIFIFKKYEENAEFQTLIVLNDGLLATGDSELIKFWDPYNNLSCVNIITGHTNKIPILIELNGGKLLSASLDNTIKIWDPEENYKCISTYIENFDNKTPIFKILPDGRLAYVVESNKIKIIDTSKIIFVCDFIITAHDSPITSLIAMKNERLITGSAQSVRIWNSKDNFRCTHNLNLPSETVNNILELVDGKIAVSDDKRIYIYDPREGFELVKIINLIKNFKFTNQLKSSPFVCIFADTDLVLANYDYYFLFF